jgi:hypothetical protein
MVEDSVGGVEVSEHSCRAVRTALEHASSAAHRSVESAGEAARVKRGPAVVSRGIVRVQREVAEVQRGGGSSACRASEDRREEGDDDGAVLLCWLGDPCRTAANRKTARCRQPPLGLRPASQQRQQSQQMRGSRIASGTEASNLAEGQRCQMPPRAPVQASSSLVNKTAAAGKGSRREGATRA